MMTANAASSPFLVASMRAWSDRFSSGTRWVGTSVCPYSSVSNAIHSYFFTTVRYANKTGLPVCFTPAARESCETSQERRESKLGRSDRRYQEDRPAGLG